MTTLADIRRLVLAGKTNAMAARSALLDEDAAALRQDEQHFYVEADLKLQGEPLESRHPVYGTGILVGVNQSGWALFHPDSSDRPFPVDAFELREVV